MKALKLSLCLPAILFAAQLAPASLVGPYTPDANTLFLFHFDEVSGGSVTANAGSKGGNSYAVNEATASATPPTVNNLLGYTAYATNAISFGNCMSNSTTGYEFGYDANNSGAYQGDVSSSSLSADAILLTNLNIGNGGQTPFTLEALVSPQAIVSGVNQEIICTDNSSGSARGFQFRITTAGQLQFSTISPSGQSVSANIPTTGTHAFVANGWYHVAVTYDGTTLRLYWTKLDPSVTAANQIGTASAAIGTAFGAISSPLIIGNENRNNAGELFSGKIDEVRISSVARGAGQMQFFSPTVTITVNPLSQNIDDGQPVTFGASATSLTALSYQWRYNLSPITGATNTSYNIPAVSALNAGNYDVVVTNSTGSSATSSPAMLVVGAGNFLSHRYSFATDDTDSIAGANGTNFGNATVSGGSLVLDGTTGTYMQLPGGLLNNVTAVTFDTWLTMGVNGNNNRIFDFGNTNGVLLGVPGQPQNYVYFSPHTGANQNLGISSGDTTFQQNLATPGILDSQSVHVTCVVDPPDNLMQIYTNGVLEAVNTNLTVSLASVNDLVSYVGRSMFSALNGDAYLTGSIDEFRIYNGALNASSVLQSQIQGVNTVLNDGPVQLTSQPASTTTAATLTVNLSGLAIGHFPISYQWFENNTPIAGATNTTYSFVANAGQNGHSFQLFASNSITGTNYAVISTNAVLTVITPPTLIWLGANGNAWDTSTLNWTNTSTTSLVPYALLDSAIFNDLGSAQSTVDLKQGVNPLSLTVNSTANYTFTSSAQNGALTGSGSLTKANTGTLVIDVTNNMSGPVLISGGTLQVGNNDTLGGLPGSVTNNASLVLDRSDSITLSSPISGTGSLTMNSGNVTLSASNSYTGASTINSGVTFLANANGLGATNGGVVVNNNGELYVTANVDVGAKPLTLAGAGVSSAGALRKGGAGLTAMYGPVTLTANTTLAVDSGATLTLTNAAGINGAAANANLTLGGSGAGNIVGPLALGSGSLTVGGGTWTVAPSNNFSGLSTINAGALRITAALSLGPVPASPNASQVTINGGALEAANNVTLSDGNIGIFLGANGTLTADTNATFTIANPISSVSGSVVLTKTGPGTVILSGNNPFNGTLNVDSGATATGNDGMLVIANNAAIQNIIAFPGLPFITIRNENAATSTLGIDGTLGSITISPDITLNGRNNTVAAIRNLAGNNTISGGINLGVGGGTYAFQSDSGTLTLSASLPETTPTSSGRSLTFQGAGVVTVTSAIIDGSNNGASNVWDNVIVAGPGILNLPVANSYSGFTGVSNGVLNLTGSLNSLGGVTVSGGLLVGSGSITGPVLTRSTGGLEAGATNTIGTLTFASSLTLGGNTIAKIKKGGSPSSDQFVGQTAVIYGGTLTVTNLGGSLTLGDSFTLFNPGASTSNFSSIAGSAGAGLGFSFTNGVLTVVHGPATNPTNIVASVSGNQLTLSWPADHQGWTLQSQTNGLTTGLSTNWVDVPGSSAVTQEVFTLTPGNPSVFYRMRL